MELRGKGRSVRSDWWIRIPRAGSETKIWEILDLRKDRERVCLCLCVSKHSLRQSVIIWVRSLVFCIFFFFFPMWKRETKIKLTNISFLFSFFSTFWLYYLVRWNGVGDSGCWLDGKGVESERFELSWSKGSIVLVRGQIYLTHGEGWVILHLIKGPSLQTFFRFLWWGWMTGGSVSRGWTLQKKKPIFADNFVMSPRSKYIS